MLKVHQLCQVLPDFLLASRVLIYALRLGRQNNRLSKEVSLRDLPHVVQERKVSVFFPLDHLYAFRFTDPPLVRPFLMRESLVFSVYMAHVADHCPQLWIELGINRLVQSGVLYSDQQLFGCLGL